MLPSIRRPGPNQQKWPTGLAVFSAKTVPKSSKFELITVNIIDGDDCASGHLYMPFTCKAAKRILATAKTNLSPYTRISKLPLADGNFMVI